MECNSNITFDDYSDVFYWNFDRKNNNYYNFLCLETLIECALNCENGKYLYKSIYLTLTSIIECALYDFIVRIHQHRHEILNLDLNTIQKIQKCKKLPSKLHGLCDFYSSHQLIGSKKSEIYVKIKSLCGLRNRIHIQNVKSEQPALEGNILSNPKFELWTSKRIKESGVVLLEIYQYLCTVYPRPDSFHSNPGINDFPKPWDKLP